MDGPRRFMPVMPIVSIIALILLGAVWFGYQVGQETVSSAAGPRSFAPSATSPDRAAIPPRLLPGDEAVCCSAPLEPEFPPVAPVTPSAMATQWNEDNATDLAETPVELFDPSREIMAPSTPAAVARPPADGLDSPATASGPQARPPAHELPQTTYRPQPIASNGPNATPYLPGQRSPQLEEIARQADSHTRRGFELASRKAYFSARAEFIQALRVVAQGLDTEHRSNVHSRALSAGLKALDEADDFVPIGSQLEGDLELVGIITGHDTPVLKLADRRGLTPLVAVQRYVGYAQDQLSVASGGEVAGSMALHALGKLYRSLAEQQGPSRLIDGTKGLACLEAAVEVCPENYLAFNDLGVLLARGGRPADAARAFEHSLTIAQDATTLANLALVYRELGDAPRAQAAEHQAGAILASRGKIPANAVRPAPPVVWVTPQEFSKSYAKAAGPWQPAPVKQEPSQAAPATAPSAPVQQASRGWPWDMFTKKRQ